MGGEKLGWGLMENEEKKPGEWKELLLWGVYCGSKEALVAPQRPLFFWFYCMVQISTPWGGLWKKWFASFLQLCTSLTRCRLEPQGNSTHGRAYIAISVPCCGDVRIFDTYRLIIYKPYRKAVYFKTLMSYNEATILFFCSQEHSIYLCFTASS